MTTYTLVNLKIEAINMQVDDVLLFCGKIISITPDEFQYVTNSGKIVTAPLKDYEGKVRKFTVLRKRYNVTHLGEEYA